MSFATYSGDAYFAAEAGGQAALRFIDALEEAVRHLSEAPGTGWLKFGYDLGIPELRAWRLRRFPYVIFYVPFDDYMTSRACSANAVTCTLR